MAQLKKRDVTMHNCEELGVLFLNEEGLYREMRRLARLNRPFESLKGLVDELFIYTPEQLEELNDTYNGEVTEISQK